MLWISFTEKFSLDEIGRLEQEDPADLMAALMVSSALVALRAAFEVLMNEGEEKLQYLLSDAGFNAHCQEYYVDREVTRNDFEYAKLLEFRIEQMAQTN